MGFDWKNSSFSHIMTQFGFSPNNERWRAAKESIQRSKLQRGTHGGREGFVYKYRFEGKQCPSKTDAEARLVKNLEGLSLSGAH